MPGLETATRDRRSYSVELRALTDENGQRHIEGHAAIFNSLSEEIFGFRETILPGAFRNAIPRSDVRALWNHNPDYVLGRVKSNTLTIREDERGLYMDAIPPDTQYARDFMVSIDRRDVDQMSFAFTVAKERWYTDNESGQTVREIIEIGELYDVSPVTYPAYQDTEVSLRTREAMQEFTRSADPIKSDIPEVVEVEVEVEPDQNVEQNAVGAGGSEPDDQPIEVRDSEVEPETKVDIQSKARERELQMLGI